MQDPKNDKMALYWHVIMNAHPDVEVLLHLVLFYLLLHPLRILEHVHLLPAISDHLHAENQTSSKKYRMVM